MTAPLSVITSAQNPLLVDLRRLQRDGAHCRVSGRTWVEGEHLCEALIAHGRAPWRWLAAASRVDVVQGLARRLPAPVVLVADPLYGGVAGVEAPAGYGAVVALPTAPGLLAGLDTVVLDRVQDAGNAGTILRSAAAFGVRQIVALRGTVALWSPKVLRAAMGGHFALSLHEGLDAPALDDLGLPLRATSSRASAVPLPGLDLRAPGAWIFGNEGQGVAQALMERCREVARIPQPGGQESLNVAAAVAICLYEAQRQRADAAAAAEPVHR